MYLLVKLIIYAIIFFVITAFVGVVYAIILSFHETIMNENTNDHAQVSNIDDQRDEGRSGGE